MKYLLNDEFSDHFDEKFPIIYKNKILKSNGDGSRFFYRNAIDNALRNNQVAACASIIEYIIKYQNNSSSSHLFTKNLPMIIEKGIEITALLNSNIFSYTFDYDEWPSTHTNADEYIRPYSESIFNIRQHYKSVFPEAELQDVIGGENKAKNIDSSKIYKIKYSINLLPQIGTHIEKFYFNLSKDGSEDQSTDLLKNEGVSFMGLIAHSDELDIFNTKSLIDLIEFKWNQYGMRHHFVGCMMHMC